MMKKILFAICAISIMGCAECEKSLYKEKIRAFDENQLAINRENIRNGTFAYNEAYIELLAEADELLDNKLISVMDKEMVAPSGDKHDYMSMGPYWWPNPDTENGLPYVQRDGVVNEVARHLDNKVHMIFKNSVITLGLAYYFSEDEKYAQKAVDFLNHWYLDPETRMKPNMDFAQIVPGRHDNGRGIGLIEFYDNIYVLDAITMIQPSEAYTPELHAGLKSWFVEFCDWWITSRNGRDESGEHNNHGTAYDTSLLAISLFAEREDVAREVVENFNAKRLYTQTEPDGSMPFELRRTKGLTYMIFNMRITLAAYRLAKSIGVDLFDSASADGRSLSSAVDYISQYLGCEKSEFPYQQLGSWESAQRSLASLLVAADRCYPEKKMFDKVDGSSVKLANSSRVFLTGVH